MKAGDLKRWIIVIALIFIEQAIKLVINCFFFYKNISIIPNAVYFKPIFNRDYSWVNSMLQLGVGKWLHIALVAVIILLIVKFYTYLNYRSIKDKLIDWFFIFIISSAMCSLIDKVFWDGSLDYIALIGLFTFDLKDLYGVISDGLLLLFAIIGSKEIKWKMQHEALMKGFVRYIFHGIGNT
jgi:signal peptidase II